MQSFVCINSVDVTTYDSVADVWYFVRGEHNRSLSAGSSDRPTAFEILACRVNLSCALLWHSRHDFVATFDAILFIRVDPVAGFALVYSFLILHYFSSTIEISEQEKIVIKIHF